MLGASGLPGPFLTGCCKAGVGDTVLVAVSRGQRGAEPHDSTARSGSLSPVRLSPSSAALGLSGGGGAVSGQVWATFFY